MSKIYVVGIGPGSYDNLTIRADRVLKDVDVVVGYSVYVDLVKKYYSDKEFLTTAMKKEVDRCRLAFEKAAEGKSVAMVCSGDAGVYGMAGLMYQLGEEYPDVDIEVIPGITAALGGGSVLGAPLTHDFAVISLSDLLTPWQKIEDRLYYASKADFCICIYNPSSKKRYDYLQKACDIMLKFKDPQTVCAIVRNIARDGQKSSVTTLEKLRDTSVDMFTTVFIGNKETKVINGKMVTPRGYNI